MVWSKPLRVKKFYWKLCAWYSEDIPRTSVYPWYMYLECLQVFVSGDRLFCTGKFDHLDHSLSLTIITKQKLLQLRIQYIPSKVVLAAAESDCTNAHTYINISASDNQLCDWFFVSAASIKGNIRTTAGNRDRNTNAQGQQHIWTKAADDF